MKHVFGRFDQIVKRALLVSSVPLLITACTGMLQESALTENNNASTGGNKDAEPFAPTGINGAIMLPGTPSNFADPVLKIPLNDSVFYARIYDNANCTDPAIAEGKAASLISPGWKMSAQVGTNTYYIKTISSLGQKSQCTKVINQVYDDSLTPYAPSGMVSDQIYNTAGWSSTAHLLGQARAGSTIHIYATNNCSGTEVAHGSAETFNWPGLSLPTVGLESRTDFTVTDELAGSISNCSSAFTYNFVTRILMAPYDFPSYNGLAGNVVWRVLVTGDKIFTRSNFDWSGDISPNISNDRGVHFKPYTATSAGLHTFYAGSSIAYDPAHHTAYMAAGGYDGAWLNSTADGGLTWKGISAPGASEYHSLSIDGSKFYIATSAGILFSSDSGKTFTLWGVSHGLPASQITWVFAQGAKIYASSSSGFHISTDGGATFSLRTVANSGLPVNDLGQWGHYGSGRFVVDGDDIFLPTSAGLAISHDGGATFTTKTTANGLRQNTVTAVAKEGNRLYVVSRGDGSNGCLTISTDNGATYTAVGGGTLNCAGPWDTGGYDISTDADSNLLAIATTNGVAISEDHGVTFTLRRDNSALVLGGYQGGLSINASDYIFVGHQNGVFKSTDGGITSILKSIGGSGPSNYVKGVAAQGTYVYAGTSSAGVAVSSDTGETYAFKTTAQGLGSNTVNGIFVGSDGKVYAATASGVSISSNHGTSFTNHTSGLGSTYVYQIFVDSNSKIYAATGGGLSISSNGGTSFVNFTSGTGSNTFYSVFVDTNGTIFGGTSNSLKVSYDGGASWDTRGLTNGTLSTGVFVINKNSAGVLYLGVGYSYSASCVGGLYASPDDGVTLYRRTGCQTVRGLAQDSAGHMFIGSMDPWNHDRGLYRTQ